MPRENYKQRLTDLEVLKLVDDGHYHVDLATGEVASERSRLLVYSYPSGRDKRRLFVRLYDLPRFRTLAISQLVWIVGTRSAIPSGFMIHHWDQDPTNNCFDNLLAVHHVDHLKLHGGKYSSEETPF